MRRIAHLSDLHFGRHSNTVAEALFASVQQSKPDLIVFSGDFTQRARNSEFAEARQFLDRLPQPKILVPGNHDVPLYDVFSRFLRPLTRYDRHVTTAGQPGGIFKDDEIAVLGVNTARSFTRKNGRVSVEQMSEITRAFGAVTGTPFKVLVTHHPLAVPHGEALVELAGRAVPALAIIRAAGVRLLLSGHHHRALGGGSAEIGDGGSVLVLHAGTAISTRTRGADGNNYNLIEIAGDDVTVRLMAYTGQDFTASRTDVFSCRDGRWTLAAIG